MTDLPRQDHRIPTRPLCTRCHRYIVIDSIVTDGLWAEVMGDRFGPGYVCADCFARAADERLIDWTDGLRFRPVSLAAQLAVQAGGAAGEATCPPAQAGAASGEDGEYTAEQYGYDAFHSGCSRLSPYPPSLHSVMWLTGYDVAADASRLSATPASLRGVENLVRSAIRQWKASDVNLPHLWSAERDEKLVRRIVAALSAAPSAPATDR